MGFVRLVSRVQTARFKMRSSGLMLSTRMLSALLDLPTEYDFGQYSQFLNTFGTHYVTQGTMGGTLEYIAVIDKKAMEKIGNFYCISFILERLISDSVCVCGVVAY